MNTRNRRNQRTLGRVAAGIAALGLVALGTACSGEDLAEGLIERQVENETGENVDIDLNGGNGLSVATEDGTMTMDENGNMVIETPDGSAVVNVDDNGNVQMDGMGANGEEVNMTADADGNMVISGPDGTTVMNASDDGSMEITSGDGSFSSSASGEIPPEFPSDVVIPDGFGVVTSSVMGDSTSKIVALTLNSDQSVSDSVTAFAASLEDAGYEQESTTTAGESVFAAYGKGDSKIVLTFNLDGDGQTIVGVSVQGPG